MRGLRRTAALAVTLTLLVAACDDGSGSQEAERPTPAQNLTAPPSPARAEETPVADDDAIALLASWGIGTYADPAASEPLVAVAEPASPVRLLREQVEVMASGAAAGVGTLGTDLDAVFGAATGTELPVSVLLAAYLQSGSETATALREALPTVDLEHPAQAVFPTLALVGFVHDLAAAPAPTATATEGASPAAHVARAQAAGPCSAAAGFAEKMLGDLFDGLRIKTIDTAGWSPILQPFGWLVNHFISVFEALRLGARTLVVEGVTLALEPVRQVLAQVAAVAGVVQGVLHAVHPLASTWEGPESPEFGVDGEPPRGFETVVHVRSTSPLSWPPELLDCAAVAGVELPTAKLEGSKVTWSAVAAEPDVLRPTTVDAALSAEGDGGLAHYRFETPTEPREWKERGPARSVRTVVTARVERRSKELADAADAAVRAALRQLLGFLPGFLRDRASAAVRSQVDPLVQELSRLPDHEAARTFGITRHGPPPEEPTPTPPATSGPVWVHVERPAVGGKVLAGRVLELVACDGLAGTWRGKLRTGGLVDGDFEVPWADLPVEPFQIGHGGVGTAHTTAAGEVYVPLPGQLVPVSFDLTVTVDAKHMRVTGVPDAAPAFAHIPIQPAPAGRC